MMRPVFIFLFLSNLLCPGDEKSAAFSPEAPTVAPGNSDPVSLPDSLRKSLDELGLRTKRPSAFHDSRNILELSFYGDRRGIPGPHETTILVEGNLERYWVANNFPHADPTTVVGPFKGNAIVKLKLLDRIKTGLVEEN